MTCRNNSAERSDCSSLLLPEIEDVTKKVRCDEITAEGLELRAGIAMTAAAKAASISGLIGTPEGVP